jgi:hypothetical protein
VLSRSGTEFIGAPCAAIDSAAPPRPVPARRTLRRFSTTPAQQTCLHPWRELASGKSDGLVRQVDENGDPKFEAIETVLLFIDRHGPDFHIDTSVAVELLERSPAPESAAPPPARHAPPAGDHRAVQCVAC